MSSSNPSRGDNCDDNNISLIGGCYEQDIRPLINLIDQLRECGVDEYLSLPTIAVVGAQSSGKSSVLEAISGIPLPRGENIVTRCPLEMRMERASELYENEWKIEISYQEPQTGNTKTIKINNPLAVTAQIDEVQKQIAGKGSDVSDTLISLSIRSNKSPNLTLIDLPGIVHARREDQHVDIIKKVKKLVMNYMTKENTIMLAVLPANVDIANNEVLELARQVDPNTKRTIAVITKPDLVPDSDSQIALCKNIKNGSAFKLKDIFMVKSRSVRELREKSSLLSVFENESRFFRNHEVYSRLLQPGMLGFQNLTNALTKRLVLAIKETLPSLRIGINKQIRETNSLLSQLPPPPPTNRGDKILFLNKILVDFSNDVQKALRLGTDLATWNEIEKPSNRINSKIKYATMFFNWRQQFELFNAKLQKITKKMFKSAWTEENLTQFLQNHRGEELPFFTNYSSVKILLRNHLKNYESHAEQLLDNLMDDLHEFIEVYVQKHFFMNIDLQEEIMELCKAEACKIQLEAQEKIKFIFEYENLIFTQDQIYKREITYFEEYEEANKIVQERSNPTNNPPAACAVQRVLSSQPEDQKSIAKEITKALKIYFQVANKRISDTIPCSIRACLHFHFSENLTTTLGGKILDDDFIDTLNQIDPYADSRRDFILKIQRLQEGREILKNSKVC